MPARSRPSNDEIQTERLKARAGLGLSYRKAVGASDKVKAAARQRLVAANIAAYAARQVATAPALTPEQIDRITAILRAGGAP